MRVEGDSSFYLTVFITVIAKARMHLCDFDIFLEMYSYLPVSCDKMMEENRDFEARKFQTRT